MECDTSNYGRPNMTPRRQQLPGNYYRHKSNSGFRGLKYSLVGILRFYETWDDARKNTAIRDLTIANSA